jgi:hypothetical protein
MTDETRPPQMWMYTSLFGLALAVLIASVVLHRWPLLTVAEAITGVAIVALGVQLFRVRRT